MKHAGELAGLGFIGKNTLLVNQEFGNMIWLGGVLVSLDLQPDDLSSHGCLKGCDICLKGCPVGALDGVTIDQKKCREHSFDWSPGGGMIYTCNRCRVLCPLHGG